MTYNLMYTRYIITGLKNINVKEACPSNVLISDYTKLNASNMISLKEPCGAGMFLKLNKIIWCYPKCNIKSPLAP